MYEGVCQPVSSVAMLIDLAVCRLREPGDCDGLLPVVGLETVQKRCQLTHSLSRPWHARPEVCNAHTSRAESRANMLVWLVAE